VHIADEAGTDQMPSLEVNITGFEKGD
jgi:hypothetical protein